MAKRKSTGKRQRFEVFKRDSFTCQYCGRRPPTVVLELDHIHPVALGGTNSEINLTTACADCNAGKSAKQLGDFIPRPDADLLYLETQQEIAEVERFLIEKRKLDSLNDELCALLVEEWAVYFGNIWPPSDNTFQIMLRSYSPRLILEAMNIANRKRHLPGTGLVTSAHIVPFMYGVLIRKQQEEESK